MRTLICCALLSLLPWFFGHAAAASLSGTIFANGGALADVHITLSDPQGGVESQTNVSNANGVYEFDVDPGSYKLEVQPPASSGFGDLTINGVQVDTAGTLRDIFMIAQSNTLSGTVTMSDGRVVAGARITVYAQSDWSYPGLLTITTDEQGFYSTELVPGSYGMKVYIHTSDYGSWDTAIGSYENKRHAENIDLSADAVEDIVLPYVSFEGRTLDSNGLPVSGVEVHLGLGEAEGNYGQLGGFMVRSDDQGEFSALTPPAIYDVTVFPPTNSGFGRTDISGVNYQQPVSQDFVLVHRDESPPVLLAESVVSVLGAHTATVQWLTDEPSTSDVTINGDVVYTEGLRTRHSVALTGLLPATTYALTVGSTDSSGNISQFDVGLQFTTLNVVDTRAPEFTEQPLVSLLSHEAVTVEWISSEPSSTELVYGIDLLDQAITHPGLRGRHSVELSGLVPATDYRFQVSLTDESGNGPTDSAVIEFRTDIAPDVADPLFVSPPVISGLSDATVSISWQTNEPTISALTLNDGSRFTVYKDSDLKTVHEVSISELTASTDHEYTVSLIDAAGNGPVLSEPSTFQTRALPDIRAPSLVLPLKIVGITHKSALIHWRTDEPASAVLEYGKDDQDLNLRASTLSLSKNGKVQLTALDESERYFFRLRIRDTVGNEWLSNVDSFITRKRRDQAKPRYTRIPVIEGLADNNITLSWETDEPSQGVLQFQEQGSRRVSRHTIETKAQKKSVTLVGLKPGASYSYSITSTDSSGNVAVFNGGATDTPVDDAVAERRQPMNDEASASQAEFTTNATSDEKAPLFMEGPEVLATSADHLIVRWVTDEPATTSMSYGLSQDAQRQSVERLGYSKEHLVVITDIRPGGLHNMDIQARDASGNVSFAALNDIVAGTLADEQAPLFINVPVVTAVSTDTVDIAFSGSEYSVGSMDCTSAGGASWSSSSASLAL